MTKLYKYPLLEKVINKYPVDISDSIYLVCCQHLLEPQLEMFIKLIRKGFKPSQIFILGKVYSSNKNIVRKFKDLGITILDIPFNKKPFDTEHKNNCIAVSQMIPRRAKIILLDDGGELIRTFNEAKKKVLFAVEQTTSGYNRIKGNNYDFPIINVARSNIKLKSEALPLAKICLSRIKKYLKKNKAQSKILVVGLGAVGQAVYNHLKQNRYHVLGFDIINEKSTLLELITVYRPNIIIGATGTQILTKEQIESFKSLNKIYLISMSSSDREFPVDYYRNNENLHDSVVYNNVTFVNNGFPIVFMGNECELTPKEMEKTLCLLSGSIIYGLKDPKSLSTGLCNVPIEIEKLIQP